jgi:hypothetical protein
MGESMRTENQSLTRELLEAYRQVVWVLYPMMPMSCRDKKAVEFNEKATARLKELEKGDD